MALVEMSSVEESVTALMVSVIPFLCVYMYSAHMFPVSVDV